MKPAIPIPHAPISQTRIRRRPANVLQLPLAPPQWERGNGPRHDDCERYSECGTRFLRSVHFDDVPARCPASCQFRNAVPRHVVYGQAHTRGESQIERTAMWNQEADEEPEDRTPTQGERRAVLRECKSCGEAKLLSAFPIDTSRKLDRGYKCRVCLQVRTK